MTPDPLEVRRCEAMAELDFALDTINDCLDRRMNGIWYVITFVALAAATVLLLLEALPLI